MADSDLIPIEDIIDKFPLIIPRSIIDVDDESHQFGAEKDIYFIKKAPVIKINEVRGTLDGIEDHKFALGTDFDLIDNDGDGEDDSIDWSIGGDSPDDDTEFFVSYRAESVISRYVGAHDTDVDNLEGSINDEVIKGAQVGRAEGGNLTRVGAIFGELGQRSNRDDTNYRALLKSIVQSFQGRGTEPGMKFAIASGIGVDEEDITIVEDTDNTGYEIEISANVDTDIIGSVINEMAELSDPSGVKLLSDPIIVLVGDTVEMVAQESTVTASSTGLGGGTLTMDGNSSLGPGETSLGFRTDATASPLTVTGTTSP